MEKSVKKAKKKPGRKKVDTTNRKSWTVRNVHIETINLINKAAKNCKKTTNAFISEDVHSFCLEILGRKPEKSKLPMNPEEVVTEQFERFKKELPVIIDDVIRNSEKHKKGIIERLFG